MALETSAQADLLTAYATVATAVFTFVATALAVAAYFVYRNQAHTMAKQLAAMDQR